MERHFSAMSVVKKYIDPVTGTIGPSPIPSKNGANGFGLFTPVLIADTEYPQIRIELAKDPDILSAFINIHIDGKRLSTRPMLTGLLTAIASALEKCIPSDIPVDLEAHESEFHMNGISITFPDYSKCPALQMESLCTSLLCASIEFYKERRKL